MKEEGKNMVKKRYVLSIFLVFLLVCSPLLSATKTVNLSSVEKIAEELSDEEFEKIKEKIIQRIIEIKESGRPIFSLGIFNKTDPDGPLEGGMDDISDLISFMFAYIEVKAAIRSAVLLMENPNLLDIIMLFMFTKASIIYFGEAFDTEEFFQDGR